MADPTAAKSSSSSRRREDHLLPPPAGWRDWAALSGNVVCGILSRLQADVLRGNGAGLACASWRRVAGEPLLWRRIDLATADENEYPSKRYKMMARVAVDRSAGRCESFRGRSNGEFLLYLANRAPSLRSLHVTCAFYMPDEKLLIEGVIKKLPLLEELVLSHGWLERDSLLALVDGCQRLQVLDLGGCYTSRAIGKRMVARWRSGMKLLRVPVLDTCSCRMEPRQKFADEHDEWSQLQNRYLYASQFAVRRRQIRTCSFVFKSVFRFRFGRRYRIDVSVLHVSCT